MLCYTNKLYIYAIYWQIFCLIIQHMCVKVYIHSSKWFRHKNAFIFMSYE